MLILPNIGLFSRVNNFKYSDVFITHSGKQDDFLDEAEVWRNVTLNLVKSELQFYNKKSPSICEEAISIPLWINWYKLKSHWKWNWKDNVAATMKDNSRILADEGSAWKEVLQRLNRKSSMCNLDPNRK